MRNNSNYLCHVNVEQWYKMQTYVYVISEKIEHRWLNLILLHKAGAMWNYSIEMKLQLPNACYRDEQAFFLSRLSALFAIWYTAPLIMGSMELAMLWFLNIVVLFVTTPLVGKYSSI